MYGVWYFAASVWTTLATVYVIAMILKRNGPLKDVLYPTHFYYIGSLLFAFTVFYAYITFAQYFIIWNANMPEDNFLVSAARTRHVVVGWHGGHLRPFLRAVPDAAAYRLEIEAHDHGADCHLGVADALLRFVVQHHARSASQ